MEIQFNLSDLLHEWHPPLAITLGCALAALIYLLGFVLLRRTRPAFAAWRACSFVAGLAVLWIALASPLEELADTVLTAHMIEHLLLMAAVPPLVWLGWPSVPLLRGVPLSVRRWTLSPMLRSPVLRKLLHGASSAPVAWFAMNATLLLWHVPSAYDFALRHEAWHDVEHVCFLGTSLLFWWVVLQPWPSSRASLGWMTPLYLISADLVNTILSAVLAFVGRPVYSFYLTHPNGLGLEPLADQTLGASIMWVFGSLAFLIPAAASMLRLLQGNAPTKPTLRIERNTD